MQMGTIIAKLRKERGLTQEALATQLDVTNQSVSKWESNVCCPDITLLPKLADIFQVSIDTLFGRDIPSPQPRDLPWEDDGVLRAVLFAGRTLIDGHSAAERIEFCYEGPALNISSAFSVICDDVQGNVSARANVTCDCVDGNVTAGRDITCDSIEGNASAGRDIHCDEICGSRVTAGCNVYCDHMEA